MRFIVIACALVLACTPARNLAPSTSASAVASQTTAPESTPLVFIPTPDAKPIDGGCAQTPILQGGLPSSLVAATGNNAPNTPYVIAHPATAAGFVFGYPLHMPNSGLTYANKILWVVGTPRLQTDLVVDGHPVGSTTPTVHYVQPANSGPGEIYPSAIDVPAPGCWQFTLRWAAQQTEIELNYR